MGPKNGPPFPYTVIDQAYQLDILLKTQGEKTKTQDHENRNSIFFLPKLRQFFFPCIAGLFFVHFLEAQ